MIDAAKFRADFPEFGDPAKYPDSMVAFWLALAGKMLNAPRWADLLDMGTELFVAHQLVLASRNQRSAGNVPAPIAAKSVDKVSVTYDTSAVKLENAGHWAATNYGMQFWQLQQMAGAGGIQI